MMKRKMGKDQWLLSLAILLLVALMMGACGKGNVQTGGESAGQPSAEQPPTEQSNESVKPAEGEPNRQILIVIDQTPQEGSEGNSFYFQVAQAPAGYSLAEMRWKSEQSDIAQTVEDAVNNGASGEDGFYFSGNGQFSGFIYPDSMKGEKGQVSFVFRDEKNGELTWKKELTLK
ncbi:hypothetical protein ACFQZE_20170 [Paenibacillus sp. GCM10027627]|uniref:hypothetical protein n=1 Tax=unclassified Paenibacillus TaxID=185978 RepID=UPI003634BCB9